jgi:hypothetical protein
MPGSSITLNSIAATAILTGILFFFAYQSYVFMNDVRFYRRANWNLSLDSGNRMLFFDTFRRSRKEPVGYLRLTIGYQQLLFGLMLFTAVLFHRVLRFVRGSQSVESEALEFDQKVTVFGGVGLLLAFILLNWIGTLWLEKKTEVNPSEPDIVDSYLGDRLSARSRRMIRYAVGAIVLVVYVAFLAFLAAGQL